MTAAPIIYRWDGEAHAPLPRFAKEADRQFVIGETYRLAPVEERSTASHSQYFARVHDLWMSLPDDLAMQFPTEDILRRHALVMTGFRREKKLVLSSPEEARKVAAFLKSDPEDEGYTLVSVSGNVVVALTALSQSYKGMPTKGQFQASKQKVLEWIEDLLGVDGDQRKARRAA